MRMRGFCYNKPLREAWWRLLFFANWLINSIISIVKIKERFGQIQNSKELR